MNVIQKCNQFPVIILFRPISSYNMSYKCITKILANRLKACLDNLNSPTQTAFIPEISIAENVLFAQELVRNHHRDVGSPRGRIKVDPMKAYD